LTPTQRAAVNAASRAFDSFMATDAQILRLYKRGTRPAIKQANGLVVGKEITAFNTISGALTKLVAEVDAQAAHAKASAASEESHTRTIILLIGGIALLLAA